LKKFLLSFAITLMIAALPTEKALAQIPSTYIFEGETIIWKIKDVPAGRFPIACAVDIHTLCEKFNGMYEAGFKLVDLNVNKSDDGQWSVFVGKSVLFTVSGEHAKLSNQAPEKIALNLMSRIYEALGKQNAEALTSEYQIGGKYNTSGLVSWFGGKFIGRNFANGERFTATHLAAASRTLPFGTLVKVTVPSGKYVVVRITDRFRGHRNRVLDLSEAAAELLEIRGGRVPMVNIEVLGRLDKIGGK